MRFLPLVLLLVATSATYGQDFSPTVIGSAGGEGEVGGMTIMWTVGEVAVATLTNGGKCFNPGLSISHQRETTSAPLLTDRLVGVSVHPNPVANELFVELPEVHSKEVYVELVDMLGSRVFRGYR